MISPIKPLRRVQTYLTLGLGAGCLAGQADAATSVTVYGPDATTPDGLNVSLTYSAYGSLDPSGSPASYMNNGPYGYFTRGTDQAIGVGAGGSFGFYYLFGSFQNGAIAGDQNYANISFDGNDDVYEAVGQFYFNGLGGGYLIALAQNDDDSALSLSDGKIAIEAIPEPSALALLALGSAGLLARRKRMAA